MSRASAVVFLLAPVLVGQSPAREAYRGAYRDWKMAEPDLERDAASAGEALGARASRASGLASKYGAARAAFLVNWMSALAAPLSSLEPPPIEAPRDFAPRLELDRMIAVQTSAVAKTISTFANDPDPGLQKLRQALDKERAALEALGPAISGREGALGHWIAAATALDQARAKALEAAQAIREGMGPSAGEVEKETTAWATYYQRLAEGARGVATAPAAPVSAALRRPDVSPVKPANAPAVPLARYVGGWTFPSTGGLFHGAEPEFLDLVVHEDGGHGTGTLYARFKLPAGSPGEPILRFDFSGDFKPSRIQTFALETADGAKGTIDLIPGPAFNLLEINFSTEPRPGKVRQGNFVLLKK